MILRRLLMRYFYINITATTTDKRQHALSVSCYNKEVRPSEIKEIEIKTSDMIWYCLYMEKVMKVSIAPWGKSSGNSHLVISPHKIRGRKTDIEDVGKKSMYDIK